MQCRSRMASLNKHSNYPTSPRIGGYHHGTHSTGAAAQFDSCKCTRLFWNHHIFEGNASGVRSTLSHVYLLVTKRDSTSPQTINRKATQHKYNHPPKAAQTNKTEIELPKIAKKKQLELPLQSNLSDLTSDTLLTRRSPAVVKSNTVESIAVLLVLHGSTNCDWYHSCCSTQLSSPIIIGSSESIQSTAK